MPLDGAPTGHGVRSGHAGEQRERKRGRGLRQPLDAVALQRTPAAELALPAGALDVPGDQVQHDGRVDVTPAISSGAGAATIRSTSMGDPPAQGERGRFSCLQVPP